MWKGFGAGLNIKVRSDLLILLLVMAAFASIFGKLVSTERFTYDESDYMYAVSKGFVASYIDRPSLSILDFVRTGIRSGLHSGERLNLSEYIRQQDDITFYRHFHAPLYFYCVDLIQNVASPTEAIARWTSLLSLMLIAREMSINLMGSVDPTARHYAELWR